MTGDDGTGEGTFDTDASSSHIPVIVRESESRRAMDDWALSLLALAIPYRIVDRGPSDTGQRFVLLVPHAQVEAARAALDSADREAQEANLPDPSPPNRGRPLAPFVVACVLCGMFLVVGRFEGLQGVARGSADAHAILSRGQFFRAMTALSLHADFAHLASNVVAGFIFLGACSRWLGGGFAVLLALCAGTLGNFFNALHHRTGHVSIGASTAIFAALGILSALQFLHRGKQRRSLRISRLGRGWPILAAMLALFAMLGVGGGRVDIGAHAYGLGVGLFVGLLAGRLPAVSAALNRVLGAAAAVLLAAAWALAFR